MQNLVSVSNLPTNIKLIYHDGPAHSQWRVYFKLRTPIDLNKNPDKIKLDNKITGPYLYETNCLLESVFDNDIFSKDKTKTRLIKVSFKFDDYVFYGFIYPEKWKNKRCLINNIFANDTYKCVVYFDIVNFQKGIVYFHMIFDIIE